jgi:hypothetical protein
MSSPDESIVKSWLWLIGAALVAIAVVALIFWAVVKLFGWVPLVVAIIIIVAIFYCWHRWGPE